MLEVKIWFNLWYLQTKKRSFWYLLYLYSRLWSSLWHFRPISTTMARRLACLSTSTADVWHFPTWLWSDTWHCP